MKEKTKDIFIMLWGFLGFLLIGIPAMLTWQGVYLPGVNLINGGLFFMGVIAFPSLVTIKILKDKYGKTR